MVRYGMLWYSVAYDDGGGGDDDDDDDDRLLYQFMKCKFTIMLYDRSEVFPVIGLFNPWAQRIWDLDNWAGSMSSLSSDPWFVGWVLLFAEVYISLCNTPLWG